VILAQFLVPARGPNEGPVGALQRRHAVRARASIPLSSTPSANRTVLQKNNDGI
jgi:hypothetical protein